MAVQSTYNYAAAKGAAGGLGDLSSYTWESRVNGESLAGSLKLGMGVVKGSLVGVEVKLPTVSSALADFEGVVGNSGTRSWDLSGNLTLKPKDTVGVISSGRVWVRLKSGITPTYDQEVYLITSGEQAGLFTLGSDSGESNKVLLNARYLGHKGAGQTALVELYRQRKVSE